MNTLRFPWLELSILLPLAGAAWVARIRDAEAAQRKCAAILAGTLLCAVAAWIEFGTLHRFEAGDSWTLVNQMLGEHAVVVDELSAPLLPLAVLLYLLTVAMTPRTKVRRFSFTWTLVSLSILLATLSCKQPWGLIGLLAAGVVPPFVELRARGRPTRVYVFHMALFVGLLAGGYALATFAAPGPQARMCGLGMLIAAVLLRSGIVPVHCWMTDLFEHASFGTALLFVAPMVGAYAAVRLVLPVAPDWALRGVAILSLITAAYAAGMALVQREARRFFCYLFLSHSSLVLVGLETTTAIGLTGALAVWLSVGLALGGFGLTLRALEARLGRLSLEGNRGLYEHTPTLAAFFLLTGLASVGFPGTFGFVGSELLLEGAVHVHPSIGTLVVVAAALNGIAVLLVYFRLFGGARHTASISLGSRPRERAAVLLLAFLILGGGLFPQPGIASRYHAAVALLNERSGKPPDSPPPAVEPSHAAAPLSSGPLTSSFVDNHPAP
jgi:NADH-quinone oxidoreductase subunit M